jgi:YidC/Oxa1 family membrane protein insertase
MEKRLILAFFLSFLVLYVFRYLTPPPAPNKPAVETTAPTPQPPPETPVLSPPPAGEETIQADAVDEKDVDTSIYRAVISNVGGVLKSFTLKSPYVDGKNNPIELIDSYASKQIGYPLAIVTADPSLNKILAEAKYIIHQSQQNHQVSLEYRVNGIHSTKVFDFDPGKYLLTVTTALWRNGIAVPHEIVWQGKFGDQSVPDVVAMRNAVYRSGPEFERIVVTGISEAQDLTSSLAGVEDQYFLAMFIRDKDAPTKVDKQDYQLPDLADGTKGAAAQGLYVAVPNSGPVQVYVGPKLEQSLKQADPRLEGVVNYGWFLFAILAKPLLIMLRWIHTYVGNWGWAIIVLTFLINTILFPLRVKQQLAMQKMQKMAPHLRQLQEKYKKLKPGDPRRSDVERELMSMNKQQMSGCLPMLLQMPLLFAFLNMMSAAIELRGAPWIWWIRDLSLQDPLYILPILMGVAMFVQMKMSPTSPDPAQARIMLITPVLVTLLFLWYGSAAGLTLYWLTGNVISIFQQWFIRKYWSDDDDGKSRQRGEVAPA